jgi:PIN domain nuclease of toxin-antitoxin system
VTEPAILLDTCAALWLENGSNLSAEAEAALQRAQRDGRPAYISPITAWEVGMLVSRRRVALTIRPKDWFDGFLEAGLRLAPFGADLLIDASFLPDANLRDPADRILAATARAHGFRLMTRDRPLLDYAAQGHLQAIAC